MRQQGRIVRHLLAARASSVALVLGLAVACGGNPPAETPDPGPSAFPGAVGGGGSPADPPRPPLEPSGFGDEPPITVGRYENLSPQEINENSPFVPVFFSYDSDELDDAARQALANNATIMKQYQTWVVTVEGHCDERGTAEYNLALGDRRALAARNYLQSLGIPGGRLRTVSYGKEFPFDLGHDEAAWAKNRRAHLMVTSR